GGGEGPYDNVFELLRTEEASLRLHGSRVRLAWGGGLGANLPRRVYRVLRVYGVDDLVYRDIEIAERIRVHPVPHGVLSNPEDDHLAYTGNASHGVVDVHVAVVGEKERIVGSPGRVQHEYRKRARGGLLDGNAVGLHRRRKLRLCLPPARLRQDLIGVRIGGKVEVHA